jgi:hypothetical protein
MMGALFTAVNEIVVAAAVSRAPPIQSLAFIDLQKVPVIQELAEERNDFGPGDKCIARRHVHDQIEVSLAIPGLL